MIGFDVQGITAVVTGAGGVIGGAIAKAFLENGANVANWDLVPNRELEAPEDRYLFVETSITDEKQLARAAEQTVSRFGAIDVLVNNAGIIAKQTIDRVEEKVLDDLYRVNIKGVALAAKHAVPHLKKSGRGRIINISSVQAAVGMETYTPYTFTKAAVSGMTRVWALELARYGITVNALCPGWAETDMVHAKMIPRLAEIHGVSEEEAERMVLSYVPQNRFIKPEEIAFACLYLSSTLGAAVNGAELFLDAGLSRCAKPGLSMKIE
jgi:3-hydroxybutyrate dehydrogenase